MAKLGNSEGYHVKSCMLGTLQALFPFQKRLKWDDAGAYCVMTCLSCDFCTTSRQYIYCSKIYNWLHILIMFVMIISFKETSEVVLVKDILIMV